VNAGVACSTGYDILAGRADKKNKAESCGAAAVHSTNAAIDLVLTHKALTEVLARPGRLTTGDTNSADDVVSVACRTNSFTPETRVLMADGTTKVIEDVEVGDRVVAFDPDTGERGTRTVTDTIVGDGVKHLVGIRIRTSSGESTIWATEHHPFWNPATGEWVDAGELRAGSALLTDDGDRVTVTGTSEVARVQRVHNLTVEGIHTYYVLAGDEPVLVHNCTRATKGGGWPLPEGGGGAEVNGRWYSEHALERMAPDTPQVRAELEARAPARAERAGLKPGTKEYGDWWNSNGPDPRGVPPSVVEAEIRNPGSTGVKVITNAKGNVVSVIPRR
jgi:hypothetical protein